MAVENSSDQLVERVIRDAKVPQGSSYRDTGVLMGMADAETRTLLKDVLRASGDYLVTYVDVPLVGGKRAYRLPRRAIRLKGVELYDEDGVQQDFTKVDSGQAREFAASGAHWHLEDNAVVPLFASGYEAEGAYLRMRYYRWPSRLVAVTACWAVTAWDGALAVTVSGTPPVVGASLDVVRSSSPFESGGDSLVVASVAGQVVTLGTAPDDVEAGDYLGAAGTTCFPQLPLAYHDVLVTAVVARVLRGMKDATGAALAAQDKAEKLDGALVTVSPREKSGQVLVNKTWLG
jgi:hypothetical protein